MTDFVLRCDRCGVHNWNIAQDGQPHEVDTPEAREIAQAKGREVCTGTWRKPEDLPKPQQGKRGKR